MIPKNPSDFSSLIDHTLLRADATRTEIDRLCQEALTYRFATVCLNPVYVLRASPLLSGSDVKVCTVIGFPLGASVTAVKVQEALQAVADGARELDMVIQLGALKEARYGDVEDDIRAVVRAVHKDVTVKAILETCLWKEDQIRKACQIAIQAGVHFVKTSTGFRPLGPAWRRSGSCGKRSASGRASKPPEAYATLRLPRRWWKRGQLASGPAPASRSSAFPDPKDEA